TTLIQDKPPGRKKIDTRLIHPKQRDDVYRFLVSRVNQGEQGFVVFPLVEESEKMPVRAAISEMENLSQNQLAHVRVGLVHGQMGKEKDQIMEDFYKGKIDVLISTTVIEVGMNVPNATVMIIENADRFGLAQLHQLRGRVGRSIEKAYCFLIANPQTDLAKQRLNVLRTTNDGLKIAEEDLKLRGPGDLLGTRQSGEPWFRLADIIRDQNLLELASEEARKIIIADPELKQYPILAVEVNKATAFN
ncbi:MAG: DNA helicase RecG, partial [Firmicutes bacterium]|nr:DNA helicase RecG [Bacillota bacterium]